MDPVFSASLLLAVGLVLLIIGAEALVRGAAGLAVRAGISPLVVGLTVVAFGTSAPEMAVSVQSALSGPSGADIAIGNVIGSNLFNILAILGLAAAVAPLVVSAQLVRFDVPVMIGVSILAYLLSLDGSLSRVDGAILFAGIIIYTVVATIKGRKESKTVEQEYAKEFGTQPTKKGSLPIQLLLVLAGLGMLVLGSRWLVSGSIVIARALGISELIIGLTIVAAGTSLPELATSVVASIKGERDIAVGNVVGSNLFNILAVLGLAGLVAPTGTRVAQSALNVDIPIMIAVSIACLPIFFTGLIARWQGFVFLFYYGAYTTFLVLKAGGSPLISPLKIAIFFFVLPLTILPILVTAVRHIKKKQLRDK